MVDPKLITAWAGSKLASWARVDFAKRPSSPTTNTRKPLPCSPGDADAKLGLAKALTEMNQTDKAQKLLEEAVQL